MRTLRPRIRGRFFGLPAAQARDLSISDKRRNLIIALGAGALAPRVCWLQEIKRRPLVGVAVHDRNGAER